MAARAMTLLGVPFRLNGRSSDSGLDCVGILAQCLNAAGHQSDIPAYAQLRGDFEPVARAFFRADIFCIVDDGTMRAGDIMMLRPGPRQVHFAVLTQQGAVHAHVGLGRVVLTPLPLPWPVIGHWRLHGD